MPTAEMTTLESIASATEARDAERLIALHADDAEVTIVDRSTPPSKPKVLRGIDEISAFVRETCAGDMTHQVRDLTAADGRIAFTVHCRYSNGTRVLCAAFAELDESGKIARQTTVQAWDE